MFAIVPTEEQEIILKKVCELPPEYVLDGLTQDQKDHWHKVKYVSKTIHTSLEAFFSGSPSPLQELLDDEKEIYGSLTDFYLSLYAMIQWGWKDILDCFAQWGNESYGQKFPFNSPGETLAAIIEQDLAAQFLQCKQGRFDFRPRKLYDLHLQKNKKAKGKLSLPVEKKYEKEAEALAKHFDSFRELEFFCFKACRQGAIKRNDRILKIKLDDLVAKNNNLSNTLNRYYRKMNGWAWQNGNRLETVREGGTYKLPS